VTTARRLRRIACLLAIAVMLNALGAPLALGAGESRAASGSRSSVAPVASVVDDIRGLFGDESEPDENEQEDDDEGQQQAPQSSGTSLPVLLLLVALATIAGAYGAIRLRRLWLRLRGWGRDMRARL